MLAKRFKPVRPSYEIKKRDRIIELGRQPVRITQSGLSEEVDARLYMEMLPSPRTLLEFTSETAMDSAQLFVGSTELEFKLVNCSNNPHFIVRRFSPGRPCNLTLSPTREYIPIGEFRGVNEVRFHVLNFDDFHSSAGIIYRSRVKGRTSFRAGSALFFQEGNYEVAINSLCDTESTVTTLRADGGWGITHAGFIRRVDGQSMDEGNFLGLWEMLYHFLTFAMGRRVTLFLPIGLNDKKETTWKLFGTQKTDPWSTTYSWFCPHHGDTLVEAFRGFSQKWRDPMWSQAIKHIIYWYAASNRRSAGVDGSLILAQAALEIFCWVYLTQHHKSISKTEFRKNNFAENLTLTLRDCKIPSNIPANYTELLNFASAHNLSSAPDVITRVRNRLVHPDPTRVDRSPFDSIVLHQAAYLYLWYIELCLLNILGYTSKYTNRINAKSVGEVESLPWI